MTRISSPPKSATQVVHAGTVRARSYNTLAPSIAQTATYTFENTADLIRYMSGEDADPEREEYGRYGNPTVRELEQRLAAIEGTAEAVAFASGMAAITTLLLTLLKSGDHIVLFSDCYRRTRQFVSKFLSGFGIEQTLVPPGDLDALKAALRPTTKLVVTESPTNPYLYCCDLLQVSEICREHGRIRVVVDSTFATPINCRPAELGADLIVHSATKYLAGHNDVMGGIVAGPTHLLSLLREARGVLGSVLDPHAAFLIARGMKTLQLRIRQQNENARSLARMLEAHARVERVFYPELPSHPSYAVCKSQMSGGGGVVSFIIKGGRDAASRVVDRCRIPRIAPSLGGVESLIEQPCLMSYFECSDEELRLLGIHPALIRYSVGIEDPDDLVSDLYDALSEEP